MPDGICLVAGCERPIHALGLCGAHYQRNRTYGDPEHPRKVAKWPQVYQPVPRITVQCAVCNCEIVTGRSEQRFCSSRCRDQERTHRRPMLRCDWCGAEFRKRKGTQQQNRWCSCSCTQAAKHEGEVSNLIWSVCACGAPYIVRWQRRSCAACPAPTAYVPVPQAERRCPNCGRKFMPAVTKGKRRRFCSASCTGRYGRRKRRVLAAGVPMAPYDQLRIFRRDGWTCQLCGKPVDQTLHLTDINHPLAATLDHIQPISMGGPDTAANVQLAHRSCNSRKGARVVETVIGV